MTNFLSTRTKEWRDQINTLCQTSVLGVSILNALERGGKTEEETDSALKIFKQVAMTNITALVQSLKYDNAYKFSYLRNFMWAIWEYENKGSDYNNVFLPAFRNQFFQRMDESLRSNMDEDVIQAQLKEGAKLDTYMHTLTYYYCNRLLNLADGGNRKPVSENSPEHHKLLQLHRQLENEGLFDEVAVIRAMLCNIVAVCAGIAFDKTAMTAFADGSEKMVNEMNSRDVMVA